jgi:hyperosmotically inducible periplasmic protein
VKRGPEAPLFTHGGWETFNIQWWNMNRLSICVIWSPVLVLSGSLAIAQTMPPDSSSAVVSTNTSMPPDNTKSNKEDPSNSNQTADTQSNNASDMELTQKIRRSVTADKSLSTYAHNVKIVTADGRVTLNGVVRSGDEKSEIGAKAASVVGKDHVVNELKVTPTK